LARESKAKEHFGIQKLKELVDDVLWVKARIDPDRYYIFREDGQEIDFRIINNVLSQNPKYKMTPKETEYVYRNIQRFKTKNPKLLKIKTNG